MNFNKLKTRLTFLFVLILGGIQAQNTLFVKDSSGQSLTYQISSLRSLSFPSGNLQINKADGTTSLLVASNIDKLYFGDSGETGIKQVKNETTTFQIFPNPVINELHLRYISDSEKEIKVLILDMYGKLFRQFTILNSLGVNNITLNVNGLHQGMYVCRTISGNRSECSKFFKTN